MVYIKHFKNVGKLKVKANLQTVASWHFKRTEKSLVHARRLL